MANEIDWNEAERLMEQLRAKLDEDGETVTGDMTQAEESAPARTAPTEGPVVLPAPTVPAEEPSAPALEQTDVPVAPEAQEVEKEPDVHAEPAVPKAPRPRKKRAPKFRPEEWERLQVAKMAENPLETPADRAQKNAQRRADMMQQQDWNTSGPVYTPRRPTPARPTAPKATPARAAAPRLTADAPKPSAPTSKKVSPTELPSRAEHERFAAETVEGLMQDLFGAAVDTGERRFAPEVKEEKPQAPAALPEEQEAPPTVTLTSDGQIGLLLPETGVMSEPVETEHTAEEVEEPLFPQIDDAQVNLFSLFSVDRPATECAPTEETSAAAEAEKLELKRSVESSEEDFEFLLELDYEDELGNTIGFEKIRDYHELGMNGQEVSHRRRHKSGEPREYEVQGQDTSLRRTYVEKKRGYIVQLAIAVALTVILFVYERASWMAALFGGPFDGAAYPVSYILFGMQILLIGAVFCHRRLLDGFLRLVRFSPIDDSLCSVLLLVTFGYHIALLFLPHSGYPTLYLSPAAGCMALLALSDLLEWYRESLAFQVISSRKQKYALIPRVSVGGKQNNAREQLLETAREEKLWYVRPVGFVRNYFANTAKRVEHTHSLGAQLLLIASIGAALGLYVLASGGTVGEMLRTAFLTFLFCLPTVLLLITSLPMFLAACLRLKRRGAIVGEETVYSCGEPTALVMPDSETFSEMENEQFEFVGDADVHRVSVLVRALLEKVQSPLMHTVDVERSMRLDPAAITLTEIDTQGVAAVVGEEQTPMLMGSVEYLQKYGIRVRPRAGVSFGELRRRLLCVAIDHKVTALFLVRYRLTADMSTLLDELHAEDVRVLVRTRDPGVHNDLFVQLRPDSPDPVTVMKPTAAEMEIRTDRVDATVVALGSCKEAARTFVTCRRVRRAAMFGKLFQVGSIVVGAVLSALLTAFGKLGSVPSVLVTLWLLFFCGVHALTSFFYLREKDLTKK